MTTRTGTTTVGVLCGVGANLVWGLAFLVPVVLPATPSLALALGRYLSFGAVSVVLLALTWRSALVGVGAQAWRTALTFALTGHLGYYVLLVQGIRWAGAPITTVIIGLVPVTVAITGNWVRREYPFSRLAFPLGLIVAGLAIVYSVELDWQSGVGGRPAGQWALGVAAAVGALVLWTSYAVRNAQFLRANPHVASTTWSAMMGVGTLVLSLVALPFVLLTTTGGGQRLGPVLPLLVASVVLGVVVSWLGTVLWSRSSALTPISVAGPLAVIQVCAGLAYVFAWERRVPPALEVVGAVLVVAGVLAVIRLARPHGAAAPQHE
ncbi:DMT family transporter [Cellulomonas sp. DKR-3]|uniref:DMT family transporter n=1 Tax=Cellulomonas fulva TaxID=2835530 RepID=A0ABS5TVZ8_9CELL|nr:DMT family transporter [Cellulomonas fulva]MBT0993332.1 DMT family transporter [Cellulomonas fulva]